MKKSRFREEQIIGGIEAARGPVLTRAGKLSRKGLEIPARVVRFGP
jgi:hypothetical protein